MLRLLFSSSFHLNPSSFHLSPLRPISTFVDNLVNSHGFSPDTAAAVSNLIHPKATEKVDSLLALLKDYSVTPAAMAVFITRYPSLASVTNPKTLKPKLDFLAEFGISGENLIIFLCHDANLLNRSLDKQFVPAFNFLVSFFGSKSAVIDLFASKRGTWALRNCSVSTELNINTLSAIGVPRSSIVKMLTLRSGPLSRTPSEFGDILAELTRFGFDPSSKSFIYGVTALAWMKRSRLESNLAVLKQFGFSDDQAKALFLKQPTLMAFSRDRIQKALNVFINEWGWKIELLCTYPVLLMSSVERKILPRMSILLLLLSKDLVKAPNMASALVVSEDLFLKKYLMPHAKVLPEILDLYKSSKLPNAGSGTRKDVIQE